MSIASTVFDPGGIAHNRCIREFITLEGQCRKDSLDCIIWNGLWTPFALVDTTLSKPFFKSNDIEIVSEEGKYFPSNTAGKLNSKAEVELYNIKGLDTIKIKTFNFTIRAVPFPQFYIDGKLIKDSLSREGLLKSGKIDVSLGCAVDFLVQFKLLSFDMEIDGKTFHSPSNSLTTSMIYYVTNTKGNKIRIRNDDVKIDGSDEATRYIYGDKIFTLSK